MHRSLGAESLRWRQPRVTTQLEPSLTPTHPGGIHKVDPSSSTSAGPDASSLRPDVKRAEAERDARAVEVELAGKRGAPELTLLARYDAMWAEFVESRKSKEMQ